MPSKVRVILTTANGCLKGTRAVAMLYSLAKNSLFDKYLPENWKKWTKLQQMKYLADYLPEDVKLTCIREVKHTRKDKSLYVKTFIESNNLPQMNEAPIRRRVIFPEQNPLDAMLNFGVQATGFIPPAPAPGAGAPANELTEQQRRRQHELNVAARAALNMDIAQQRPRRPRVVRRPIEPEEEDME